MFIRSCVLLLLCIAHARAQAPQETSDIQQSSTTKRNLLSVPYGVILVKGAWSSVSDDAAPRPETSHIENGHFLSSYFGISYALSNQLTQGFLGPPPSEDGRYVLADINRSGVSEDKGVQHILITAEDLFFTRIPVEDAAGLTDYLQSHLGSDYRVLHRSAQIRIAGRAFSLFSYESPISQLYWTIFSTDVRCHAVSFVFTSHKPLEPAALVTKMQGIQLPPDTGNVSRIAPDQFPPCIKNYARAENVLVRVDPSFNQTAFNSIPVRILIGTDGSVAHIHILSAFPDQSKAVMAALEKWKFKPYLVNGHAVPLETGIIFGRPQLPTTLQGRSSQ